VLAAAVLGTALAYMSDDMLNLAIPSVALDLHASAPAVQWILNAYYIPLVALVLVAGALGDVVGHRRVFTTGPLLFGGGAVLCSAAPDVGLLMAGRAVQGAAAAMLLASGLALVTIANPGDRRDRAVAQFVAATAAVPALGPSVSGALVDWLSWRWLFVVPLVLPLGALAVTRAVSKTPRAAGRRPDVRGSLAALSALDDREQGLAAGVNNAMGQLSGLLAIIVLPALAGLAGASQFTGPAFSAAYPRALTGAAVLAALAIPVTLMALPRRGTKWAGSSDASQPMRLHGGAP
jgi:MFS family permease